MARVDMWLRMQLQEAMTEDQWLRFLRIDPDVNEVLEIATLLDQIRTADEGTAARLSARIEAIMLAATPCPLALTL